MTKIIKKQDKLSFTHAIVRCYNRKKAESDNNYIDTLHRVNEPDDMHRPVHKSKYIIKRQEGGNQASFRKRIKIYRNAKGGKAKMKKNAMEKKCSFGGLLILFAALCCLGCGRGKEDMESSLFPLEGLQDENGLFQYKNIPFGSSSEEVMEQIPGNFVELELEAVEPSTVNYETYYLEERFDFYGCDASLFLDFTEDQLETVKIQFKTEEEQFQEMLTLLTELYGEPELTNGEGGMFESEIYTWEKDNTRLQAMLLKRGESVSGAIGVFKME